MTFDYATERWRFCPLCGGTLETRREEGIERRHCPSCRRLYYDNPVCVTMCAVTRGSEVLLGLRSVPPRRGYWALPGGFMEIGESPIEAARRELREETGLRPLQGRLLGLCAQDSPAYGTVVVAGYHFPAPPGPPEAGSDLQEVRFFPFSGLPELAFRSNVYFVDRARARAENGG